jgi:hypothetical protein
MPIPEDVDEEEEPDEDEPDEEDVEEDEDDDDEEEEDDDDDEGEDEELTSDDVEAMDRDELEELIEEEDLTVKFNAKTSDEKLAERVLEALGLGEEDEEDEDEDDEEGDDEEEAPDYDSMTIKELTAELSQRGLNTKVKSKGKKKKTTLVKRLEKDDESSGDEPF